MIKKTLVLTFLCVGIISLSAGSLISGNSESIKNTTLGSNSNGTVYKIDYSSKNSLNHKIAIVSGMHPRETLSKNVSQDVARNYALTNKVNIVNYIVEVNENYDNVFSGRNKGESLVSDYIIPDIAKSGYEVVIICHDHNPYYGQGYYVATPTMDANTLNLANEFRKISPEYKYCERDPDKIAKSKSISKVDAPIAATGTPIFIYEIPEWQEYNESFNITYKLIDTAFKV